MYLNKKNDENKQQNCPIFNFLYPENYEKPRFPYIPKKYKVHSLNTRKKKQTKIKQSAKLNNSEIRLNPDESFQKQQKMKKNKKKPSARKNSSKNQFKNQIKRKKKQVDEFLNLLKKQHSKTVKKKHPN